MTISRKAWEKYITTLRDINEEAAEKLVKYLNTHDVFSGTVDAITVNSEELKPFIDYAYAIVSKYGEASASLAAEMYDLTAELEGVFLPPAELAPLAEYGDVAKAINGTIKTSQNYDEIASAATRWVKMAASDTTLHNAQRDHAQFAWIPHSETCAFCLTLASRGWQYMSKKALKGGHAEHIHSNCDCQYTIRHDPSMTVEGYDPDEYLRMYQHAEGSTPQERINSMRRAEYAASNDMRIEEIIKYAAQTDDYTAIPKSLVGNFDDFSPLSISNDDIGSLNELNNLAIENNYEYGEILFPGGHTEPFTSEMSGRVAMPLNDIDGNGLRLYHSHTNVTPLSSEDFEFLCNERVDEIANIASNKDVFVARIGDGWRPTNEEYSEAVARIESEVNMDIISNPEGYGLSFDSSPQERNYVGIREQAYRIAREFGWQIEAGNIS